MDRRRLPREPAEGTVFLTCLSSVPESATTIPSIVRIVDESSGGLRIETDQPIAASTLVRLDLADSLLLGEVVWCVKVGDRHQIGLKIEESLQHIGDLSRLVASLLGTDVVRPLHQSEAVEASCD